MHNLIEVDCNVKHSHCNRELISFKIDALSEKKNFRFF